MESWHGRPRTFSRLLIKKEPHLKEKLPKNLAFDLARCTEAAAIEAGRWIGLGEQEKADSAATEKMIETLNKVDMDGRIVMGEHHETREPLFHHDYRIGSGDSPELDLVIDAIDGSAQLSRGSPGALSAAAVAPAGSMKVPVDAVYMNKIIVDQAVAPSLVSQCLDAPPGWTLALVARAKKRDINTLTVFVLDRSRHQDLVNEIRAAGAHVMLAPDGDIAGGILACTQGTGVDILMGIGGVVEGLLAACAVKAIGGMMIFQFTPASDSERAGIIKAGFNVGKIYNQDELVTTDEVFFSATGINDGPILDGVKYKGELAATNSLILRGESKTRRLMSAEHLLSEVF